MMDPVTPLPAEFRRTRALVVLPDRPLAEVIAPVEVLVQEGLPLVAVPVPGQAGLDQLKAVFGERATFGAHGVAGVEDAESAIAQGAGFVLTAGQDPAVVEALTQAGVAAIVPAMTPLEARRAAQLQPAAILVEPAGPFGADYPSLLQAQVGGVPLLPAHAESDELIRAWLDADAAAVCVGERLLAGMFGSLGLTTLRNRSIELVQLLARYRTAASPE